MQRIPSLKKKIKKIKATHFTSNAKLSLGIQNAAQASDVVETFLIEELVVSDVCYLAIQLGG